MNGSPLGCAGGTTSGGQMTSGTGFTRGDPITSAGSDMTGLNVTPATIRPSFYPRLDPTGGFLVPNANLFGHLNHGQNPVPPTATVTGNPMGSPISSLHHHPASPLLHTPFQQLYSALSPTGYAAAAAAVALGRPPYLDPSFLGAGSLPRYPHYLHQGRLGSLAHHHHQQQQHVTAAMERSMSESESLLNRWQRAGSPKGIPPHLVAPTNPVLPLIPAESVSSASAVRIPRPHKRASLPEVRNPENSLIHQQQQQRFRQTSGPSLPTQPYYPTHFMRGTVIQLANGELKRVEDLITDDFIRSAGLSSDLKMDSSTVVRIEEKTKDTVLLGFSVGEQKVQVSVEATVEHPFFVIGQGWSSCNPERTRTLYGLPCQRLQVGDICISLTHRDVSMPHNLPNEFKNDAGARSRPRNFRKRRRSLPPSGFPNPKKKRARRWSFSSK